jgi:hypothetical protein
LTEGKKFVYNEEDGYWEEAEWFHKMYMEYSFS